MKAQLYHVIQQHWQSYSEDSSAKLVAMLLVLQLQVVAFPSAIITSPKAFI
jgi:hypothetical protein